MKSVMIATVALLSLAAGQPSFAQNAAEMSQEEIARVLDVPGYDKPVRTRGLRGGCVSRSLKIAVVCPDKATPAAVATGTPPGVYLNIHFELNSAALRPSERRNLAKVCGAMRSVSTPVFRVVGHTDASGASDYNLRLSRLRAEEVRRHLVSDCGIAAARLVAEGWGERDLLPGVEPASGANRRVEFRAGS